MKKILVLALLTFSFVRCGGTPTSTETKALDKGKTEKGGGKSIELKKNE